MRFRELTPIAAAFTALGVFVCCIPLGLTGAAAVLSVGMMLTSFQQWFLAASALLFGFGVWQAVRRQTTCRTRTSSFGLLVLALSGFIVIGVLVFPQIVAIGLADYVI